MDKRSMRVHPVGIDMVGDPSLKHILKYGISKSSNMYLLHISLYCYSQWPYLSVLCKEHLNNFTHYF